MKSKILKYCICLCLLWHTAESQLHQPQRFEVELNSDVGFVVSDAGKEGLFLFRTIENTLNDSPDQLWEVYQLDTALNVRWRREYLIAPGFAKISHFYSEGKLYLLFSSIKPGSKETQ